MTGQPIAEAKVRIRVDDTGFREELRADIKSAVTGQAAQVNVTADTGRARTDVAEFRDVAGRELTIHVDADTRAASRKVGDLRSSLLGLGTILAAPLGATAAGGLLGAVGGIGVAATGIGAFAAGALPSIKGVLDAQKQLTQEQKAYNLAVAENSKSGAENALVKQRLTLAGLTDAQKAALGPIHDLQSAYKDFAATIAPQGLSFFTQALQTATHLLPAITPLAQAAGTALGTVFHQLNAGAASPAFHQFVQQMSVEVGPAIRGVAVIVGNLGLTIGNVFTHGAPLINAVLGGLDQATAALARFTASSNFDRFIAYAIQEAPVVGHDLAEIAGAVVKVGAALGPMADELLRTIGNLAHLVGVLAPIAPAVAGIWLAFKGYSILGPVLGSIGTFAASADRMFSLLAADGVRDAISVREAWSLANAEAARAPVPTGGGSGPVVAGGSGGTIAAAAGGLGGLKLVGGLLPIMGSSDSVSVPSGDLSAWSSAHPTQAAQYGWKRDGAGVWRDSRGTALTSAAAAAGVTSTHRNDLGDLSAANPLKMTPTHRTDIGDLAAANPTTDQQMQQLLAGLGANAPLTNTFGGGAIPGGGGGGGGGAGAALVDFHTQISSGLATAVRAGVPAVKLETVKLRDTILQEFKNPAAARERQQALALLAQEAPKALRAAQVAAAAAATVLGKSISDALVKAVQSGNVESEITRLEQRVTSTLRGEGQGAERKALLADLKAELTTLTVYANQYKTLQTTLKAEQAQLGSLQAASTSFHDSLISALSVNVGGALTGSGTGGAVPIATYLQTQLSGLQTFQGLLGQVKAAGGSTALISQLSQLGPSGNTEIQQLLSSGGVGKSSDLLDAINGITSAIADQATKEVYDPQIAAVIAEQQNTTAAVTALNATILKAAQSTGKTQAQGLTGVGRGSVRSAKSPVPRKQHKITAKG